MTERVESCTYENYQNAEDLEHEPPVAGYARVVLQQFPLSAAHVGRNVNSVGVDTLNGFSLFRYHLRKLCEDLSKLCDR